MLFFYSAPPPPPPLLSPLSLYPSNTGTTWRFRPLGNPNFVEINVGRDVLVVAGTMRITGTFYTNVQLFHNKNSAGGIWCVLGGNLIITGLALNTITGANAQWGTGLQAYVGTFLDGEDLG